MVDVKRRGSVISNACARDEAGGRANRMGIIGLSKHYYNFAKSLDWPVIRGLRQQLLGLQRKRTPLRFSTVEANRQVLEESAVISVSLNLKAPRRLDL